MFCYWFRFYKCKVFLQMLYKGISKNPYYLFGLTFNSSPLERKRSVFRDAHKCFFYRHKNSILKMDTLIIL